MRTTTRDTRLAAFIAVLTVILGLLPFGAPRALAADPVVTLVGSLQYELGCADDWAPECTATRMTNDGSGTYVYSTDQSPAGTYEFKVALNNSWAENYGANGEPGGANIPVTMTAGFVMVMFSMPYFGGAMEKLFDSAFRAMAQVMRTASGT